MKQSRAGGGTSAGKMVLLRPSEEGNCIDLLTSTNPTNLLLELATPTPAALSFLFDFTFPHICTSCQLYFAHLHPLLWIPWSPSSLPFKIFRHGLTEPSEVLTSYLQSYSCAQYIPDMYISVCMENSVFFFFMPLHDPSKFFCSLELLSPFLEVTPSVVPSLTPVVPSNTLGQISLQSAVVFITLYM